MEPLAEEPSEELANLERVVEKLIVNGITENKEDSHDVSNEERDTFSNNISNEMPRILQPRQKLRDYCIWKDLPTPVYMLLNVSRTPQHQKWYTMELTIPDILTVNESAISKRMSEFRAATKAIQIIGERDPDIYRPIPKSNFSLSRSLSMDYLSRRRRRRVNSNGSINTVDLMYNTYSSYAPSIDGMDSITENGDGADSLYGSEHGNKFILDSNTLPKPASLDKNATLQNNQNITCNNSQSSNSEQVSAVSLDEGVFVEGSEATSARSSALTTPSVSPKKTIPNNNNHSNMSKLQRKKSRSSSSILASIFSLGIWKPKPRVQTNKPPSSPSPKEHQKKIEETFQRLDQPDSRIEPECLAEDKISSEHTQVTENGKITNTNQKSCECRHFSLYGSVLCCNNDSPIAPVHLDRTSCAMLLKYCVLLYLPIPYYDIHFDPTNSRFSVTCRLLITNNDNQTSNIKTHLRHLYDKVREHRGDLSGRGTGDTLRSARNAAAEKVIIKLRSIGAYLEN